jgi:tetratricopeptide (TPR) repeat protein
MILALHREKKVLKTITTTSALLAFALASNIGVAGAFAQKRAKKKRVRSESSASLPNKSRTKRVTANESAEATSSPAAQPTPDTATVPDKPGSAKPAASPEAGEPGKKLEVDSTKRSGNNENPGESEPLSRPVENPKGTNSPNDATSLRDQIEAAASDPERIRLQLRLAEQLIAAGQKAEAKTELHTITQSDAFDPQGFYNAGNALARLGDYDDAINAYRKAIEQRKGRYSRALNNLGVLLLRTGRWDEAQEAFLSALKLESFHYAEASYNLGRLYSSRGQRELAIREWRRALSVDPDHSAAAHALAGGESGIIVTTESSRAETAAPEIHSAPIAGSSKASTTLTLDAVSYDFLQRARTLRERGKLEEAVDAYGRVISRSHGYFAPANLELSYVLITLKRNDEALANLLKVMNRDGARYPIGNYYLARLFESKGDLRSAEELFTKASTAYKTENNSFLLDLMRVRERQGNFKGALSALEEYVSAMEKQGMKPSWAEETLSVLRQKATGERK